MPRYLVAQSELPEEREKRRARAGKSAGETYKATLLQLCPGTEIAIVSPADEDAPVHAPDDLERFDAVFLTGSPMHVYCETEAVNRQLAFMRAVFASGVPSFGSCAGLQIAAAAAGGKVRKMPRRAEAGLARRIVATPEGREHPMLVGRPSAWDALAIHGDEVAELPDGSRLLASNGETRVQAAEIRHDGGVFWGVQYHPELALGEVASALRAQAQDLVEGGLATSEDDVGEMAKRFSRLHRNPADRALAWQLGVDAEVTIEHRRRREILNFLEHAPALRRVPA